MASLVPIVPAHPALFSRRIPSHYSGRHFGSDAVLDDPHRNPILDVECGWYEYGCKARQKRARQRADLMATVQSQFQPLPEDTGPGVGTYVAVAAFFVGTFAVVKLLL